MSIADDYGISFGSDPGIDDFEAIPPCTDARFEIDDIRTVDGNWEVDSPGDYGQVSYGQLKDGRWWLIEQWADYTFDGASARTAATLDDLVRFGMSREARKYFNLAIPEDLA